MDSYNPNGVLAGLGIPPLEYGKIITMMLLKVCDLTADDALKSKC